MKYRHLGSTGVKVSTVSLGSWLTYGGYVAQENAISTIHKAYDLGINFFDTANVYMRGEAEKVVGKAIKAFPREAIVLSTKVFFPMGDGPNDHGLSRKHIMEQANASLKRLNTDYIDLYYCHRFDPETPIEETLRAFDDLIHQGKINYIGVSQWTAAQITEAAHIADQKLLNHFVANQSKYNMLSREIEAEVIPSSAAHGVSQVCWSPLAQGVLTGKYSSVSEFPAGSRAAENKGGIRTYLTELNLSKVNKLKKIAAELGVSMAQLALAWVLRQEQVASVVVGASKTEQIVDNAKAADLILDSETERRIEEILSAE
ncbi:aldo/keto reductase family protein [Sporolactobacillus terrae]|uniref:Aldo/keto reductase n=1 Tax=Sporolactobacillus terrae TaxID=269673 RepID=A0ABX5QB52_9BACL|nr:aldo/keto reductase family protein [Sporolactobacillus terrae]QAA23849.1 aldo/keto reductase [Sporolactobacillus terrae]QAA26820.1 aldo/keto reductase [Sporolactobacillus terrae]UAK15883.1 aldo/keto reductase family protein [Sporolactobacillus terrae]